MANDAQQITWEIYTNSWSEVDADERMNIGDDGRSVQMVGFQL